VPQPRKLHDEFFKRAKAEGYAARSAYKLIEINEKRGLIRRGDTVLDLGCAPGSWLQVTQKLVGKGGRVVGIDLTPVEIPLEAHVRTVVGDAYRAQPRELLPEGRDRFDVVLSDMAPSTSGHGDDFLSARLCERTLDLCPTLLREGGTLCMKILEGEPTPGVIARAKAMFREAGTTKPKASRDVSREMFIWGKGFKARELVAETIAAVAVGANVGDAEATMRRAIEMLSETPGVRVVRTSRFVRTSPVGPIEQPEFLNAAALLETRLPARGLLERLQEIERSLGRDRAKEQRWGPRAIDLDLILFGDATIDEPGLTVPHPRMHERLFVLAPLAEVAPGLIVPGAGKTVKELRDGLVANGAKLR